MTSSAPTVVEVECLAHLDPKPPVGLLLQSLPIENLHHARLRLRHPAGFYGLSLTRLVSRFFAVLDELESVLAKHAVSGELPDLVRLTERVESLLYALAEHMDDCKNVIRVLFDSEKAAKKSRYYSRFGVEIARYRNRVGEIVNSIKHRTGRLCGVMMHAEGTIVPGYYVESAIDARVVGPDPNIHNGGDTAISLCRDLKSHFVHLYHVARSLEAAVVGIWDFPLAPKDPPSDAEEPRFLDLARRLRLLPDVVYFDERLQPYPRIEIRRSSVLGNRLNLSLETPAQPLRTLRRYQIRTSFNGDGFTNTFKVPYLSAGWQKKFS